MNVIELRERNSSKNVVSNMKDYAFAWAGAYANYSKIFINGIEYFVRIEFNSNLVFTNNKQTGLGDWVIFENIENKSLTIYGHKKLKDIRENEKLTSHIICFNDESFYKLYS